MRVGILGSGLMGAKLGTIFARAGHEVVFSYSRSRKKLEKLAKDASGNARAGTPREAAENADVVLLAVHWSKIEDVLNQTEDLSGKVVVTCSLPMNDDDAGRLVVTEGEEVELRLGGNIHYLPVKIRHALAKGTAGLPVGLRELPFVDLPAWGRVAKCNHNE